VSDRHPMADDPTFRLCIEAALASPCQKLRFGAVLTAPDGRTMSGQNRTIDGLEGLCTPTCIRLAIQSRTESMLGACGHAEERLLWQAARAGWPMESCSLFIAGVNAEGQPNRRKRAEFTCLRCAVAMHYSGIGSVYVAMTDPPGWVRLDPKDCLATAKEYALGEKKV